MLQMRQCGLNLSLRSMFSSSSVAAMSSCKTQPDRSVYVCCVKSSGPVAHLVSLQLDTERCIVFF